MRWLITLSVLAAAAWWLTRLASAVPPDTLAQPPGVAWTVFDCEGDRQFAARVGEGGTVVYFPNGEHAAIPDGGSRPYAGGMVSVSGAKASFAKGGGPGRLRDPDRGAGDRAGPRARDRHSRPVGGLLGRTSDLRQGDTRCRLGLRCGVVRPAAVRGGDSRLWLGSAGEGGTCSRRTYGGSTKIGLRRVSPTRPNPGAHR